MAESTLGFDDMDNAVASLVALNRASTPTPSPTSRRSRTPTPSPRRTPLADRSPASWDGSPASRSRSRSPSPRLLQQIANAGLVRDIVDSGASQALVDEWIQTLPARTMTDYIHSLPTPTRSPPTPPAPTSPRTPLTSFSVPSASPPSVPRTSPAGVGTGAGTRTVTSRTISQTTSQPAGVGGRGGPPSYAYLRSLGKVPRSARGLAAAGAGGGDGDDDGDDDSSVGSPAGVGSGRGRGRGRGRGAGGAGGGSPGGGGGGGGSGSGGAGGAGGGRGRGGPPTRMNQDELQRQLEILLNDQRQTASGRRIAGITTTNTITTTYKDGGRPTVRRTSTRVRT